MFNVANKPSILKVIFTLNNLTAKSVLAIMRGVADNTREMS